jgi:uncharacterized membrane protein YfcA
MHLLPETYVFIAIIAMVCSTLQSFVGFGFALFSIPLLLLLGLPLPQAVAISLAGTFIQGVAATVRLHRHIRWRAISVPMLLRLLVMPVGLCFMDILVKLGTERVKQVVSAVLLLLVILWSIIRVQPRERVSAGWGILTGAGSGLLGGTLGMGGPPCVLWALAHRWTSEQMRASLFTLFTVTVPFQVTLLNKQYGEGIVHAMLVGLATTPLMVAGSSLGLWLSSRLPVQHLRSAMLGLLAITALYSIATPIVQGLLK